MNRINKIELHLREISSASDLHELLFSSLKLPDYYGKNWDAFWDVIENKNVLPKELVLHNWSALESNLPKEAQLMKDCLTDYQNEKSGLPCKVVYT